jgi:Phage derived protein Gp49-like (DUF891)
MVARPRRRRSPIYWPRPDAGAVCMAYRNAAGTKFEGRPLGGAVSLPSRRISRLVLCFHDETLIVLHGFIKKTQKTPAADLALARRRMTEVMR